MVALGILQKPEESISTDVEQGKPLEPQATETTQISEARQNNLYGDYSGGNINQLTRAPSFSSLQYDREKEEKICLNITVVIIIVLFIICIIFSTASDYNSGSSSSYDSGHTSYSNNYYLMHSGMHSGRSLYGGSRSRSDSISSISSSSSHGSSSHGSSSHGSHSSGGGRSGGRSGGRRG